MADGTGDRGVEKLSFPHLIKWAEMVTRAEAERELGALPISGSQMFALVLLEERGEATSADLARMMRITPQALTPLLRPLRDNGYITQRTDTAHRRRLLLRLSEKGNAVVARGKALAPRVEDAVLERFTPEERAQLKSLLARVARRFE